MGRAKTKAKQKSNVPIPFPHDGPVFRWSCNGIGEDNEKEDGSLKLAIHVLNDVTENEGDCGVVALLTAKLFQILKGKSTTTKEQLQALQTFKCSFINLEKQIADGKKSRHDSDWNTAAGLYRLLLEWSLSYQTPLPFQRAIQANLKMLGSSTLSLETNSQNNPESICKDVLESIWKQPEHWENPMHSLDIAINYAPLRENLQKNLMSDCLSFLGNSETVSEILSAQSQPSWSTQLVDNALQIVTMLKVLLTNWDATTPLETNIFQKFVFALLTYPKLPSDGFNTLGILHGKLLFMNADPETDTKAMVKDCIASAADSDSLSPLARLSMVQGIAATLDANVLITEQGESPLELCWEYSLRVGQTSTDPLVRWASIKGLSTLASRWKQYYTKTDDQHRSFEHMELVEKTLDLVFDSWENPPLRKLGMAIPGLFKALVQLLPQSDLQGLCKKVLEQPPSRKGRYLALEILLPYMPAMSTQADSSMMIPIESLMEGIGDRGANAGSIANLWIKVLKSAWKGLLSQSDAAVDEFSKELFETWTNYWMPSFCKTIIDPNLTRRKQVVAFCLPRLIDLMKEFDNLREQLSLLFVELLKGIETLSVNSDACGGLSDRILWAELEVTRFSSTMKLSDERLDAIIASCLHKEKFQFALVHSQSFIRIVAFQAMKCVVASYGTSKSLEEEIEMWKYALPYSIKTNESKEYLSNLLQCLSSFLDRLSAWEAGIDSDSKLDNLPIFESFAIDFLLDDVVLSKGSYSGTIADKELFGVSLLGCILAFALQDESYSGGSAVMKKNAIFNRKRSAKEEKAMERILSAIFREDVLSALFGLLHSIWDNTRATTFQCLTRVAVASQSKKMLLAKEYRDGNQRRYILARGIYLASSPRQRESDTGARMICFLYASLSERSEKDEFLSKIVDLSRNRVASMTTTLNEILMGNSASSDGSCLPLAHGLVHTIRLCIDHDKAARRLLSSSGNAANVSLNESMIEVFCKALQLSLSVVADVRDGEAIDGIDEETLLATAPTKKGDSTPLNVNTGAIGANGTFSSVSATNIEEEKARLAMQRVVVGSWLLTKETCAAIASVITTEGYLAPHSLVSKVGQLLLSTLTTLKHAGAAFAARDSLQLIAIDCLRPKNPPEIRSLPDVWSRRLIDEISLNEKVRNSTLRRSTGYALGFLAMMRADIGNKTATATISVPLLQKLLMLSLPPERRVEESLQKLKTFGNQVDKNKIFVYASNTTTSESYVRDDQYEARCRVHALNVLRMIILDAPLSSLISPFVGDCVISAILGYDDPSWAIRNSSTMVFAAAMLRVVDPDKNASNGDKTSSNAITLTELFRRYPPLATFIPSVLRLCLEEMESHGNLKSEMFPILLMLSRVQPVVDSSNTFSEEFIPLLFRCLGSKDFGIRHVAARSLSNLSSNTIASKLLLDCKKYIAQVSSNSKKDWNRTDGILLAMELLDLSSKKEILDSETQKCLFGIAAAKSFPPTCRATALKVLASSPFIDKTSIQCACTEVTIDPSIQSMVGGTLLYKTASEAMCVLAQEDLWQPAHESTFEKSLSQLNDIFTNDIVDVRLYGVKCFKKSIYGNIDRLLAIKTKESTEISISLASMLLDCISSELGRGIADTAGSHIPTLRRLSRCLLETLQAIPKSSLPSINYERLWSIAHTITEREAIFLAPREAGLDGDNYLDTEGGNVLSSNAIEMMAAAIAMEHTDGGDTSQINDRMTILLKVVGSLNDPNGSWRSRYSAALALETCCSVLVSEADSTETESLKRNIMMTVLEMLQDSDPDVRRVAVQAATILCATKSGDSSLSKDRILLLPEWTLEYSFPVTFATDASSSSQQSSIMEFLQAMVLDHCRDLTEIVETVQDEFGNTDHYGAEDELKDLVNVNTARKIFEDEDPNPFQEKILLNQLAVQSMLRLESSSSFALPSNTVEVLTLCDSALTQLLKTQTSGGMVHEVSRYPTVFPALHSILCASATALHLSGSTMQVKELQEKLQSSAETLVLKDQDQPFLHPSIRRALKVLKDSSESSKSEIVDLLFLLNQNKE